MPNAANILRVPFNEAIKQLQGLRRSELVVRFSYRNYNDEEITVNSLRASDLFRDWYGDCNLCPPNDTPISDLHILMNPTCTALDITHDLPFEQFMDALEEVTTGHNYRP